MREPEEVFDLLEKIGEGYYIESFIIGLSFMFTRQSMV